MYLPTYLPTYACDDTLIHNFTFSHSNKKVRLVPTYGTFDSDTYPPMGDTVPTGF